MQPSHNQVNQEAETAFLRRVMQNALVHRADEGLELDSFHFYGFQAAGLLTDASPPQHSQDLIEALKDPQHNLRVVGPLGPSVFIREQDSVAVIDVDSILIHPNLEVRLAAFEHLFSAQSDSNSWLTEKSNQLISKVSSNIKSNDIARWRPACLEVVSVIRQDFFFHLAGLRQAIHFSYNQGIEDHMNPLMNPGLDSLNQLIPPVLNPVEQIDTIRTWITEFARKKTFEEAVSLYIEHCGYLPLARELGVIKLVEAWKSVHANESLNWEMLIEWEQGHNSPSTKYQLLLMAMYFPELRPKESMDPFWEMFFDAMNTTKDDVDQPVQSYVWEMYCVLASHYIRHLESLWPGSNGNQVACLGWWLADKVVRVVGTTEKQAEWILNRIVYPAANLSSNQWLVSRSPTLPSLFRYCSLEFRSVWLMSLLSHLNHDENPVNLSSLPKKVQESLDFSLKGHVLSTPFGPSKEDGIFAFEENQKVSDLCKSLLQEDESEVFSKLIEFKQTERTTSDLLTLLDVPTMQSYATIVSIKAALFSGSKGQEEVIEAWLSQTDIVVKQFQKLDLISLDQLLEVLSEFHQRFHSTYWKYRIPHLLALSIERSDDEDRVKRLTLSLVFQSLNAGIGSPLERAYESKWKAEVSQVLLKCRDNLSSVAQVSEGWIKSRIRAVLPTISKLVGPRKLENADK